MAEFASPGIISTERDFSQTIQMLGTSTGGTVINSKWGFVDTEMTVGSEEELVNQAGKPTNANYRDWFVAANFLLYTSALKWVRAVDDETALNAVDGNAGILIKNKNHLEVVKSVGSLTQRFAAKCPGDLGDSIGISLADANTFATWEYKNLFETAPDNSGPLAGNSAEANDELHVVVLDALGLFSGVPGSVLETYPYLSKAKDGKGVNGQSNYYINVLNSNSEYVWALTPIGASEYEVVDNLSVPFTSVNAEEGAAVVSLPITNTYGGSVLVTSADTGVVTAVVTAGNLELTFVNPGQTTVTLNVGANEFEVAVNVVATGSTVPANVPYNTPVVDFSAFGSNLTDGKVFASLAAPYTVKFDHGEDGDTPGKDEYMNAFDVLNVNPDVSLLFAGGCGNDLNQPDVSNYVLTLATKRGDMVGFVSPKFSDVVGVIKSSIVPNLKATKEAFSTKNSYGVYTTGYKLQYDRYNDINRWVPGNGDDAGLCARTENLFDVWLSPAGMNRGHYMNCISLAFNPDQNARDALYTDNINPIVTFPKDGTLLYGDKTMQAKNSVFSYIGTRRLFNYLRRSIRESAKYNLFEFNTTFSRQAFKDMVEPILREIKARNGIFDFYVRCDETNNTSTVIQKGEFHADIVIKPQYSIQGIRLSFTAVRREVSFDEVVVA